MRAPDGLRWGALPTVAVSSDSPLDRPFTSAASGALAGSGIFWSLSHPRSIGLRLCFRAPACCHPSEVVAGGSKAGLRAGRPLSVPLGFHRRRGVIPHGFWLPALRRLGPFAARRFKVALMIVARPRSRNEASTATTSESAGFCHIWCLTGLVHLCSELAGGINKLPCYAASA